MKMESLFQKVLLSSSLLLLLTGCGQTMESPEPQGLTEAERQESVYVEQVTCEGPDEELVEHSCEHGTYGPFVSVSAAAPGSTTIPNVNLSHTAYNVTLPKVGYRSYKGSVTYRPVESTEYAIFLSRFRGLKIYDGTTLVAQECSYIIDETACGSLRRLVTADLEANTVYRFEFDAYSASDAAFTLLVEEAAHEHEEE
ncbi:hypothetical protein POL68_30480 [Stigmatella sp. ncwal1]|uniref:Lipoprotein n=1 Tax=Stigmatella ashevillensis TaxID=2995309 RepID=A0ABT5DGN2_9BACT|nr:hypothetical protein [Stigmatella ashevillena]MDC0712827.1 hypothetical protein [Stigmatella ashevillena]